MLAQRSQETIEIIEELDALEHNCAINGYLFDSKDRRADREDRAVVFVSDSDFEGKEVLWPPYAARGGPGFEFASSPVNPALLELSRTGAPYL